MSPPLEPGELPRGLVIAIALAVSLAPVTVQTVTLVLTQSLTTTGLVASILACLFVLGGMRYLAFVHGTLEAVPRASIVGLSIAVVAYHMIALPMAVLINARFFAHGATH